MIQMNDFKTEPGELRRQMIDAAARTIDSGWYVLGKECEEFEKAWAQACGVRHGVGVANGMDAIEIGLRCLGAGPGDEVITTAMTAYATVMAILRAGAEPVLADIEPDDALISVASIERCLSSRTKAVLPVHLYGRLCDMPALVSLCNDSRVTLVEDCAQSHLASAGGVAGSFGRISAFSFYPTKNLGAIGDGGMLMTSDDQIAERARMLRNYGQSHRYHHPLQGLNSRLDEIQAAILQEKLRWLPAFTARRREIANHYLSHINNPRVRLPLAPKDPKSHVWHLFVLHTDHREALAAHLAAHSVQTLIHYPVPIHHQPPCRKLRRDPQGLACSERHAAVCLSIPCHPQMTDEQVACVVAAVNSFQG